MAVISVGGRRARLVNPDPETVRLNGQLVSAASLDYPRAIERIRRQGPPQISLAVPQSTAHQVTTSPPTPMQSHARQPREPVTLRREAGTPGRVPRS
jgi:hypothetical protein